MVSLKRAMVLWQALTRREEVFCSYYQCLRNIKYRGTEEEWKAISKGSSWDSNTGNYTITYNYDGE